MRAMLDGSGCISCRPCVETCSEVLHMADGGVAEVYQEDVLESAEATAVEAQEGCPVSVITVD